ncbi:argonaute 5 [Ancistrocladus abbreviatus]
MRFSVTFFSNSLSLLLILQRRKVDPSLSLFQSIDNQNVLQRGGRGGSDRGGSGRGGGGFSAPNEVLTPEIWVAASTEKLKLESPPTLLEPLRPPPRPGFGTTGMPCVVQANHFRVQLAERDLHHYDVSISPEVTSKSVCRDIINQLVEAYNLYAAGPLPFSSKEFDVPLVDKDVDAGSQRKECKFKVSIKLANSRQFNVLQDKIQHLDIVLRAAKLSEDYNVIGRSFFSTSFGKYELGEGLEYWRGYYQSLRPTQMGLSLNIG